MVRSRSSSSSLRRLRPHISRSHYLHRTWRTPTPTPTPAPTCTRAQRCLSTNLPTYDDLARLTHCHTNNQPPFYHVTVHHSAPMWSFRLCRGRAAVENGDVKMTTEVRDGERGRRCHSEGAARGIEGRTKRENGTLDEKSELQQRERETDTHTVWDQLRHLPSKRQWNFAIADRKCE